MRNNNNNNSSFLSCDHTVTPEVAIVINVTPSSFTEISVWPRWDGLLRLAQGMGKLQCTSHFRLIDVQELCLAPHIKKFAHPRACQTQLTKELTQTYIWNIEQKNEKIQYDGTHIWKRKQSLWSWWDGRPIRLNIHQPSVTWNGWFKKITQQTGKLPMNDMSNRTACGCVFNIIINTSANIIIITISATVQKMPQVRTMHLILQHHLQFQWLSTAISQYRVNTIK